MLPLFYEFLMNRNYHKIDYINVKQLETLDNTVFSGHLLTVPLCNSIIYIFLTKVPCSKFLTKVDVKG